MLQDKHSFTKHLFLLSFCSDPLRPPSTLPHPSSGCLLYPCSLYLSEPLLHAGPLILLCVQDSHTYACIKFGLFSLANLSHVHLIIRPAHTSTLRVEGSLFLLPNSDDSVFDDGDDDGNDRDEEGSNSEGVDDVAQKTLLRGRILCRSHTITAPCSSFLHNILPILLTAKCQGLFRKLPSLLSFHITPSPRPFACHGAPHHISMTDHPTKASSEKCCLVLLHRSTVPFPQPIVWAHTKEALMGGTPGRGICVWMVFFCCFKWVWGAFQSSSFTNTKGPKSVPWLFSQSSL